MAEIIYTTTNLVTTSVDCELPLLLTCPHGGNSLPPDVDERQDTKYPIECKQENWKFEKKSDLYSKSIVRGIADKISKLAKQKPCVVMAEFDRLFIDCNRPKPCAYDDSDAEIYYDTYFEKIGDFLQKMPEESGTTGLLFMFDIHSTGGIENKPGIDIFIGTDRTKSIQPLLALDPQALWNPQHGLIKLLTKNGCCVTWPGKESDQESWDGGYTVQQYGTSGDVHLLNVIQFEIGPEVREDKYLRELLEWNLAKLTEFVFRYSGL
jgi:hypothetical protein